MSEQEHPERTPRKPLMMAGLALLVVAAAAVVVLLVDPFGWNLLDKASGLRDEAAGAMPPDVGLYAGLDLINFSEETLTDFSQPFLAALAEPGVEDLAGGLERLNATLAQEIGLTLSDDIMPWLGRSVGLAITDLELLPDGTVSHAGWLLVAGSQDRRAADAFLASLSQELARRGGAAPEESEYRGRRITTFAGDEASPLGSLAFTRSAGQVILASDEATVRAAIDAQQGQSLADDETFQNLTASLPEERGLTLYADQARLPELSRLLAAKTPLAIGPLDLTSLALPPGAAGVSIVDQGLRLDLATPASDNQNGPANARQMAGRLPDDTLALLSGDSLGGLWQSLKAALAAGGSLADFEESMALLQREFGYNPDQDLLPLLDGEWVVALLPAAEGLLPELTGQPLGLVLLSGGRDAAALQTAVDDLSQSLADQRLPLVSVEVGQATATTVDLATLIGAPLPLYGVDGQEFFLGTDADSLAQVVAGDGSPGAAALAGDPAFQAATALLADGYRLSAYVDVGRLAAQLPGGEGLPASLMEPVKQVIAASGPAADGVRPGVVFVIIE